MGESYHFKNIVIDFIAGTLGGTACVAVGQPLDTIKVKLQTYPHLYKSSMYCIRKTFIEEGVRHGLYAGTLPSLIANVAENSVLFAAYGFCQKFVQSVCGVDDVKNLNAVQNAFSGSLAAFFSSFTLCPTELIKCRLQAMYQTSLQNNSVHRRISPLILTGEIIRKGGFKSLFRGIETTIVREMSGYFFFFGGYEACRELLRNSDQAKGDVNLWQTMVSGAVGGLCFWTFIFPADVIKSRIQIIDLHDVGLCHYVKHVFKTEGLQAFYSGLLPTLVRTIPTTATLFVVVEYSKKFLHEIF